MKTVISKPAAVQTVSAHLTRNAPDRIFVRGVNWIGDAIMATPALRHLRESFPRAKITVMVRPWVAAIYENNPDVDELWALDDSGSMTAFFRAARRVKEGKFDLGIALANSFRSALLMQWAGIPRRAGFRLHGRGFMLNEGGDFDPEWNKLHQVYHYLFALKPVCGDPRHPPKLYLRAGELEREEVRRLFMQRGLDRGQPIVGVAPGSINSVAKRWLPERFAATIDAIHKNSKAGIVLLGSPREAEVLGQVASLCKAPVHDLTKDLSLPRSIAAMERLSVFIGNDAGGMHMAAALGIPTAAIFGPTRWVETGPFSANAVVVREDVPCSPCMLRECPLKGHEHHRCMTQVTVERVLKELKKIIAKSGRDEVNV